MMQTVVPFESMPPAAVIGLVAAVMGALVAGAVGHGVLRPLLEARGVRPWTVRDSVGSLMLVLLGSGAVSGAAAAGVATRVLAPHVGMVAWVLCLALLAAGGLMMRLGLLALRKLT